MRRSFKIKIAIFGLLTLVVLGISCKSVSETDLAKVLKEMEGLPDIKSFKSICPSKVFPSKAIPSGYVEGRCADDPSKCLDACRTKGDGESCYALARLIENEKQSAPDYHGWLYFRACELGVISGCTNRAAGMIEQESDDENIRRCSADTFEKSCEFDDPWGCASYASAFMTGEGRPRDFEAAERAARKACKLDDTHKACQSSKKTIELIERMRQNESAKPSGDE